MRGCAVVSGDSIYNTYSHGGILSSAPGSRTLDWLRDGPRAREISRIVLAPSESMWHLDTVDQWGVHIRADLRRVPGRKSCMVAWRPSCLNLYAHLFSVWSVAHVDARLETRNAEEADV